MENNKLKFNSQLAEIVGIMLGDGCLYLEPKTNKFQTSISFHKKETDYLDYVKSLFQSYFQYKFCTTELSAEFLLRNTSVFVGNQLIESGLSVGNKVKNKVTIPFWIFNNKNLLICFVRGFFDTDGCVYRKYNHFSQIQFKLGCLELVESLHEGIVKLNFHPTKIQKEYNQITKHWSWKFYLSRQEEIDRFFREVKPKNSKHIERYEMIRNGDAEI